MSQRFLPLDTAQRLRAAGLKVIEIDGYKTRGRPASTGAFGPVGVLNHHTGARDVIGDFADDLAYAKWMFLTGRPGDGLGPPLVQTALSLEGTIYLGALGRANHAGKAKSSGSVASGDGNAIYVGMEWMLSGTQKIPVAMYAAGAIANAVLLDIMGSSEQAVSCHFNTSITGKWDIGDPDGVLYNGHKVLDVPKFRRAVKVAKADLHKSVVKKAVKKAPAKKPVKKPVVKLGNHKDFTVHLVPGQKTRTVAQVRSDMGFVKSHSDGHSSIVVSTERDTPAKRKAVLEGLPSGYHQVLENENPIAFDSNWKVKGTPESLLLAAADPGKAKVSPNRYLSTVPLENQLFKGVVIKIKGLHLVSEANCEHVHVFGRAWREKTWKIQLEDVLDSVEADHKAGFPVVLLGDFNTGVKFTGKQLDAALKKRFPGMVTHVHNGHLDHIFLISTKKVELSEVGKEIITNNTSDHNMVSARIRATKR